MEGRQSCAGQPRSGRKFQPVRISTATFDNPPGSGKLGSQRKTLGLSSRQPIRNIHKLLESPKRNARKRLDNLYDSSKPKGIINPGAVKSQALNAKKVMPNISNTCNLTNNKSTPKTGLIQHKQNSSQSRLLPPGTIKDTYLNVHSSKPRMSINKPIRESVHANKNWGSNRPSDVPEESSQLLEDSTTSIDKTRKLKDVHGTESQELLMLCPNCSCITSDVGVSTGVVAPVNTNIDIPQNATDTTEQHSSVSKISSRVDDVSQRPTVIVTQKEAVLLQKTPPKDSKELLNDRSHSELCLQTPADCFGKDESQIFQLIEMRLQSNCKASKADKVTESISELINANYQGLITQQKYLVNCISQYEVNLVNLKAMLDRVNVQLDEQKTLQSKLKSIALGTSTCLQVPQAMNIFETPVRFGVLSENNKIGLKDNTGHSKETSQPEITNKPKTRRSRQSLLLNLKGDENVVKDMENKEPSRRRSARLAMKNMNKSLPAETPKPAIRITKENDFDSRFKECTTETSTPARSVKWGRRSERPLREYMVLKSALKFLNTPDAGRYRIGSDEKVKLRDSLEITDQQALLTDNLLKSFHSLYTTPS